MSALAGLCVLAVDDIPENIDVLFHLLEDEGVDLRVALSGRQALDVVAKYKPDVILLDVRMPEMDGFETCRRLRLIDGIANLPIIFLTAHGEDEMKEEFDVGGTDYMVKPVRKDVLVACLEKHL